MCEISSPDYIACLTTLSHVGLLFPGVYNRQLKPLMTRHLIPNLLTKDEESATTAPKSGRRSGRRSKANEASSNVNGDALSSDWTLDGNVPLLTRAKVCEL